MDDIIVCRPKNITCRWLLEITRSISVVCYRNHTLEIQKCTKGQEEAIWKSFMSHFKLEHSSCHKNKTVQSILNFDMDYNDILCVENKNINKNQ